MASGEDSGSGGMSTWVVILIVIIVILAIAAVGLTILTQYKKGRFDKLLGRRTNATSYRPPAPAPGGIKGWFSDITQTLRNIRNPRTAGGAYESTSYGGGGRSSRRGFGALDPDGAWDARVDHEADLAGGYYEEQELGDPGHGPYGGSGYGEVGVGGIPETRGRSQDRHREVDARYDEEMHGGHGATSNPFSDSNALRTASPRPVVDTHQGGGHKKQHSLAVSHNSADDSPTERKSMFRENV